MTKKTREQIADLRAEIDRLKRADQIWQESYGRYDTALRTLMRDLLHELIASYSSPTSIASASLIEALAKASRTIHTRSTQ